MMGRQTGNQSQLFYLFNLERRIPADHLLRRINPVVTRILVEVREQLAPFYSDIGRPSIDPELMIRMLIVGYCYGIRFERRLCEELELHLAYRWFCRLDLDDKVPDHSTFKNPFASIRLLRISILQPLRGDFCNTICQEQTLPDTLSWLVRTQIATYQTNLAPPFPA